MINKDQWLACRTHIGRLLNGFNNVDLVDYPALEVIESWNLKEKILIESLPHLPIIKDLIVISSVAFDKHGYRFRYGMG